MADSYNNVMGIVDHSGGPTMWHLLQDDAANTTIAAEVGSAAALVGGANTADQSVTGPTGWLPKGINLQGNPDSIDLVGSSLGSNEATLVMWCKHNATGNQGFGIHGEIFNGATGSHYPFGGNIFCSTWRSTGGGNPNRVSVGSLPAGTTNWHHITVKSTPGANGWAFRIDGSDIATATGHASLDTSGGTWRIGRNSAGSAAYLDAAVSEFAIFDKCLTDAQDVEVSEGPELRYVSGATFGDDGAYNVGTWALPAPFDGLSASANGTPTYIVSAVNAAGDVLESDTTSTGTLDLSGNAGNICYLLVRATNSGDYDVGDYATRTSGFGSAGDGYYEIASVVAAGGGGPDYTITQSAAASVEVSGLTGSLVVARNVTQSAPAAVEVAGLSGSLEVSRSLTQSSPAAVEVAGLAGSLSVSRQITQSAPASVEVSGLEGSLTYSEEGGPTYTLTQTAPATVEVAGLSGSLAVSRQIIQSASASVEVEGQDGTLTLAYQLSQSATADVEVSGLAGSLIVARRIVQSAAAGVAVQGRTGTLTYSEEVDTPTTVTGNYAAVAAPQNAGAVAAPQNYQAVAAPQNYAAVRVSN